MNKLLVAPVLCSGFLLLLACGSNNSNSKTLEQNTTQQTENNKIAQSYQIETVTAFNEPWAITSLPDQRLLITERKGRLKLFDPKAKTTINVLGVPNVSYGGQGGLGDVILHPDFAKNHWIYLSYAEPIPP